MSKTQRPNDWAQIFGKLFALKFFVHQLPAAINLDYFFFFFVIFSSEIFLRFLFGVLIYSAFTALFSIFSLKRLQLLFLTFCLLLFARLFIFHNSFRHHVDHSIRSVVVSPTFIINFLCLIREWVEEDQLK